MYITEIMQMVWYYKPASLATSGSGRGTGTYWRAISRRV